MASAPSSEAVALQILEIPHDIDLVGQAGPAASGTNDFLRKRDLKMAVQRGRGVRQGYGLHHLRD